MKIGCVETERVIKKKHTHTHTKKKTRGKRRKVSREKRARKLESTPKFVERERRKKENKKRHK